MNKKFITEIANNIHCVPKKEVIKLSAITFSNLSRFSKFFHCWKVDEISNKTAQYFPPHLKYVPTLPWESWIVQTYCKLQQKNQKASHIWQKRNVYVVIRLNGDMHVVFYSICSKWLPFTCTHARRHLRHSSTALSMMLWSTICHNCCKRCFNSSVSCTRDW